MNSNGDQSVPCRSVVAAKPTTMADYQSGRMGRIADG